MAVLIEGISVIIRKEALNGAFSGDWEAFMKIVPNQTLCADDELVRVGFMTPSDVESFIEKLESYGLCFLQESISVDISVVDQQQGPTSKTEWLEFGYIEIEKGKTVSACRLTNSKNDQIITPTDWVYEDSLSFSYGFISTESANKNLKFLRHENGVDVYRNLETGKVVFMGRTGEL